MGWLWSSRGDATNAYDSLDPKLKDFLDKQSPPKQSPTPEVQRAPALPQVQPSPSQQRSQARSSAADPQDASSRIPSQSLYQDGRYADLWKTYRPQQTLSYASSASDAAGTPSAQDQLTSLISSYKGRQAELSRAALSNCVEAEIAEQECWKTMNMSKVTSMCRSEAREFNRCYTLQARFLRAMGYMDLQAEGGEAEWESRRERMLGRADEIYAEVKRREALEEEAKSQGKEAPTFEPLGEFRGWMAKQGRNGEKSREQREKEVLALLEPAKRTALEEKLKGMTPTERDLEVKLRVAEAEAHVGYGVKMGEYMAKEVEDRRARQEAGKGTFGDFLKRIGGWSQ